MKIKLIENIGNRMSMSIDLETFSSEMSVGEMQNRLAYNRLKTITSSDNLLSENEVISKNIDKSASVDDMKCNRNMNNVDYALQLETLQKTIDDLKEDNERFRLRKEGTEIVTKLLHETRQDKIAIQKKKRSLEIVVHTLQSRLEQNNIISNVSLQDDDIFIPGPSKKIMDDLVRENARLKTMVRYSNPDQVRQIIEQKKLLQDLEEFVKQSQIETMQYKDKVANLERVLQSSDNEKDKEIISMKGRVKMNQESYFHDVQTLTDETIALRDQLREMAARCQQVEKYKHPMKQEVLAQLDMVQRENASLQRENASLQRENDDVKQKNHRWNEYVSQNEKHVQQLHKIVSEQRDKQSQIDQLLLLSKEKLENTLQAKAKLEQELHNQVEINKLQASDCQEYEKLRRQMVENPSNPDSDMMAVYKHQIQVFKQDFEQEREDREKAQQRVLNVQAKMNELEQNLERYRQMLSAQQNANIVPGQPRLGFRPSSQAGQRFPGLMAPYQQYRPTHAPPQSLSTNIPPDIQGHLTARSVGASHLNKYFALPQGTEESEYVMINRSESANDDIETDGNVTSGEDFRCPTCAVHFPLNQAEEFKQHTDSCTIEEAD